MDEERFDVAESIKNQAAIRVSGSLNFVPPDGICWSCGKQIYAPIKRPNGYISGITVDRSKNLVTGCPHCNRSYCS